MTQDFLLDAQVRIGSDGTNVFHLSFPTHPGEFYAVQQSKDLRVWRPVIDSIVGKGGEQSYEVPIDQAEQYFRVALTHVEEFAMDWPVDTLGSTHEVVADQDYLYVTGQNMHHVAKVSYHGDREYLPLEDGSGPHGMLLDKHGQLWVSLEFKGSVVRLDKNGTGLEEIDIRMKGADFPVPINPAPHGIGLDADGETIWFTGKRTSTLGRINPDRSVQHFELGNLGAIPIYLHAGPDGNMWGTELTANAIVRITPLGVVTEFTIPSSISSRPIAILPDPTGAPYMWFTLEATSKVGKIDMDGNITQYVIPKSQDNMILGGLAFDEMDNLWVQQYVDVNHRPEPEGDDYLIKVDRSILTASGENASGVQMTYYKTPSRGTVMHRIGLGRDGNMWFTELKQDKLGRIQLP